MLGKDPRKVQRSILRQYGAHVVSKQREHTTWQMPDGARIVVRDTDHHGTVAKRLEELRSRYGPVEQTNSIDRFGTRANKPDLDLNRVVASTHAKERLALMQSQAKVTFQEVLHAIRIPERVLWSDRHGSWMWVRDRLAVAVVETGDSFVITTILWTSNDLFEQYPRPA